MHEGIWSTRLGMAGVPAIAEEIMLKRDLDLLRYTDSRLHFTGVSLERSIELIAQAKAAGLQVSASVTPYHLMFTDESLQQYDSHFKVTPPLREARDVEALRKAVTDGVIDCIATHHFPQDTDNKQKEFEYAAPGMTGLETCFGILGATLPEMTIAQLVGLLAVNPRRLFARPVPEIREGATASLTIFDPTREWTVEAKDLKSKSRNTPLIGRKLKGQVLGTYHNQLLNRN
jgi:dihydroorotase